MPTTTIKARHVREQGASPGHVQIEGQYPSGVLSDGARDVLTLLRFCGYEPWDVDGRTLKVTIEVVDG